MKNNCFETHNLNHLSPSSINEYIQNPSHWLLKVSGFRENIGIPAFWRGTAVDEAISYGLFDTKLSIQDLQHYALNVFDKKVDEAKATKLSFDVQKAMNERSLLPSFIQTGVPYFRQFGEPKGTQGKIVLRLDDIPIDIVGYYDLHYTGIVRDIKTTSRMPSKLPNSYNRQLSIYATAMDCIPVVDYVCASKSRQEVKSIGVTDVEEHMKVVRKACLNIMNLLSYSDDIHEVASLLMPDFDDWRWSESEKLAAIELFNMR